MLRLKWRWRRTVRISCSSVAAWSWLDNFEAKMAEWCDAAVRGGMGDSKKDVRVMAILNRGIRLADS
eukprot:1536050-Lingulodinium_polyedra.AAC.1